jgi:O-antigen/teichoic acid export membrane protein
MKISSILTYVFGKYLELGILAFLLFFIATKTSPEEYSFLTPLLLTISYSTLLYSGLGASYIKKISLCDDEEEEVFNEYLTLSLFVAIIFSLSYVLVVKDVWLTSFVACLLVLNSMRSFGQSYFRAKLAGKSLAKFNLIYPLLTLVFFFSMSGRLVSSYINSYIYSQIVGMSFTFILLFGYFVFSDQFNLSIKVKLPTRHFLLESLKLFFVNFVSFTFLMMDKFLIVKFMPDHFVGQYQLYENFSNIFHLSLASGLYLLTPYLLSKYNSSTGFDRSGKLQFWYLIALFIMGFIFYFISHKIILLFFLDYADNVYLIGYQVMIKVTALSLFLPSIYYSFKHEEKRYLAIATIGLLIVLGALYVFHRFGFLTSIKQILFCVLVPFIAFSVFVNISMYKWNKFNGA